MTGYVLECTYLSKKCAYSRNAIDFIFIKCCDVILGRYNIISDTHYFCHLRQTKVDIFS